MSQEKLIPADQTKCAELARFVVRTTFEDLPEAIAQKAVRHMLLGKAAAPLRFGGAVKK